MPGAAALLCLGAPVAETVLSSARQPQALLLGIEAGGVVLLVLALVLAKSSWVVLAVGARLNGHASFGTRTFKTTSL